MDKDMGEQPVLQFTDQILRLRCATDQVLNIPINQLHAIAQIFWGDQLIGAAPDSLWIFISSTHSFVADSSLCNWHGEMESELAKYLPELERFEAFVTSPPKEFSRLPWLLQWSPALATPVSQIIDTEFAWRFLRGVQAERVDMFFRKQSE